MPKRILFLIGLIPVSKWGDSTGEESLKAKNTWEERFKHKSEREEESQGEKRSPPTLSLLFTDFIIILIGLKSYFILFFDIRTKNVPPHFSANDCDLFLHIMLALGYFHSMMLRGDHPLLRGHDYSTETTSCWHAPRPLYNSRIFTRRSKVGTGVLFYLNWSSSPMSDIQLGRLD